MLRDKVRGKDTVGQEIDAAGQGKDATVKSQGKDNDAQGKVTAAQDGAG